MSTAVLQIRATIMERLASALPSSVTLVYDPMHALPDNVSQAVVVLLAGGQPAGGPTGVRDWKRGLQIYLLCRRKIDSDAVLEGLDAIVDAALPSHGVPGVIELERGNDEYRREEFGETIAAKVVNYQMTYRTGETSLLLS